MSKEDFYSLIENEIIPDCIAILKTKGEAYTSDNDRLGGLKNIAAKLDNTPEKQWMSYFVKHFDAVTSYIKGNYSDSEKIEGRIVDMINYLFILYAVIIDKKNNE